MDTTWICTMRVVADPHPTILTFHNNVILHHHSHSITTFIPQSREYHPPIIRSFIFFSLFFAIVGCTLDISISLSSFYLSPLSLSLFFPFSISNMRQGVLAYHDSSLPQALLDLFPNIGIDRSKFATQQGIVKLLCLIILIIINTKNYVAWMNSTNRRQFFIDYAKDHHFDAFNPDNWYIQPRQQIMASKVQIDYNDYNNWLLMSLIIGCKDNTQVSQT